MAEEKKIVMPPPPPPGGCFEMYPTDRDVAIQLISTANQLTSLASQILNRKYNKWVVPPVIMPMAKEPTEEA